MSFTEDERKVVCVCIKQLIYWIVEVEEKNDSICYLLDVINEVCVLKNENSL